MARKKPRKNYRKGTRKKRHFAFLRRLATGFYVIAGAAAVLITSVLFIFAYDLITQCDYFKANSLKIEGVRRLSQKEVLEVARVKKGMNVLAINLGMARKRLLAQPWIANAEIRREIPTGLYIKVQEHTPVAIIDLGRKFLINENGRIFKEWTDADPADLPLVSGLAAGDVRIHGKTGGQP